MVEPGSSDKVDLVFVVDNSRSMQAKHEFLAASAGELLGRLVNPPCVDATGAETTPSDADAACPTGSERLHVPVRDLHVGVISNSIGSVGGDACDPGAVGNLSFSVNDRAHLLDRSGVSAGDPPVPTYEGKRFLVYDRDGSHSPPGEAEVEVVTARLGELMAGVREVGCGYEHSLEAMYRFLVDPQPYTSVEIVDGLAVPTGTDAELLAQRAEFLRPDSVVMVVLLSDENDCSVRAGGSSYLLQQLGNNYRMPRARAACAVDPQDACCRSCDEPPGPGCDDSKDACNTPLSLSEDHPNMRCWDTKRRFGVDFLQPIDRYVSGLTDPQVATYDGVPMPNPLITADRDPTMIYLSTIVGVPWQLLSQSEDPAAPPLSTPELDAAGAWPSLVGDFEEGVPPSDPHMVESIEPRPGLSTTPGSDPITGNEALHPDHDDLQAACIFRLPEPLDCSIQSGQACDCAYVGNPDNSPLCMDQLQTHAQARPGLRLLELTRRLDERGVPGSACVRQTTEPSAPDFGYRPALRALTRAAARSIATP
ncbi:MAG: hypothetical protein R3B72_32765 [Polyangiaceae bacterium]